MTIDEAISKYVIEHIANSQEWHLPFLPHIHFNSEWFLSLHAVMLVVGTVILGILFMALYKRDQEVPTGLTNLLETFIVFVRDEIAIANMGEETGRKFAPFLCSLFFFILVLNLMGMIPIFVTATANFSVTLALALVAFVLMTIGGIIHNGPIGFIKAFMPHGVPLPVLPVIFVLEFAGVFIKSGVLALRLWANMMAGHLVLFSIIGVIVSYGLVASPVLILTCGIFALELMVAFIQAFIFVFLTALFVNQIYHPAH
jgi:F-type H+-transporting ATPase subunit a